MTCRAAARLASGLLVTAGLLGPLLGVLTAAPASAATAAECDSAIYDEAGSVADSAALLESVGAATRAGGLVRVRAYGSVPAGDLDAYIAGLQADCPSWRAPDGSRRSNLLVLAVSTGDRTTGLYYGSAYDGALGGQWSRIQADLMNPRFRDGDFSTGLAEGLSEATRLIQEWQHPRAAQAATAASDASSSPTLVLVLVWLAALAALAVGGVLAFRHLGRRRREQASLAVARTRAQAAYEEASAAFVTVDGNAHDATAAHAAVMALASDEDDEELTVAMSAAQAAVDAASQRWITAQERWGTGSLDSADEDQAKAARATLSSIADDLADADALVAAAAARAFDLTAAAGDLPAQLQRARDLVSAATVDLAAASASGLNVTAGTNAVAGAAADLEQAAVMIDAHRIGSARALIAQIRERAEAVSRDCAELPARLEAAGAALTDAAGETAGRRAAQLAAVAALDELVAAYGRASVVDIDDDVTGIGGRLDDADAAVVEGRAALALRSLEGLEQAGSCTGAATAALAGVAAALAALEARRDELPTLAAGLPGRLAALDAAIEEAGRYTAAHSDDVDPARAVAVDAARVEVRALAAQFAAAHCDLPRIAEQVGRLEGTVTEAAAAAASDVRTAEEGRRRAQAALAKAKADLDASEAALAGFGRRSASRSALNEARSSLAEAQASTDVARIVSLSVLASTQAEQVERVARQAHEQARAEQARAEQERSDREDRDARDTDGGGGSSSFGSGGGGGGSSTW